MSAVLTEPSATAPAVELADYLEVRALLAADGSSSAHDLQTDLRRAGGIEVLEADPDDEIAIVDQGGDESATRVDDAMAEIADRERACGTAYPFVVEESVIQTRRGAASSVYTFLLLLATFGVKAGPAGSDPTKAFEDLSVLATGDYFGAPHEDVLVYPFGFPRRVTPAKFIGALNDLCLNLGEGQGARKRPTTKNQKDARLDLVASKRFPDRRRGQLIGFGQCAAGKNWREKVTDLQPETFCKLWLLESPTTSPIGMFFVPYRLDLALWEETAYLAGVVFDRCRISHHVGRVTGPLAKSLAAWSAYVLKEAAS